MTNTYKSRTNELEVGGSGGLYLLDSIQELCITQNKVNNTMMDDSDIEYKNLGRLIYQ